MDNKNLQRFENIYNEILQLKENSGTYISHYKFNGIPAFDEIKKHSALEKVKIYYTLLELIKNNAQPTPRSITFDSSNQSDYCKKIDFYSRKEFYLKLLQAIIMSKVSFNESEFIDVFVKYKQISDIEKHIASFISFPILRTINQIIRYGKENGISEEFSQQLLEILKWKEFSTKVNYGSDVGKAKAKLLQAISECSNIQNNNASLFKFDENDCFGINANKVLMNLKSEEQSLWNQLLLHASSATSSKPTKKFIKNMDSLIDEISVTKYRKQIVLLFDLATQIKIPPFDMNNEEYTRNFDKFKETAFLSTTNTAIIKGIIWSLQRFHDADTLRILSDLALKCYHKIPGVGATAQALGNACVYVLAQTKGLNGVSYLTRLKLRVTQNNTKKLIQKYIDDKAAKLKLMPSQIEEIAVLDYKFNGGERSDGFEGYQLQSKITAIGKVALTWIKPDGKIQKTAPAFIKKSKVLSNKLKAIKANNKQAAQSLTAQRDRLDNMFLENRTWNKEDFEKYYLNHGLMGFITKKLVWNFDKQAVIWHQGQWQTNQKKTIELTNENKISLWHPVFSTTKEIVAWRDLLDNQQIQQPLKQVYREIYVLTDAEINTNTYSNRMAAHILKQHQFNALAKIRNWKYALSGCFDNGGNGEMASKYIPAYDLSAEFWINDLNDVDTYNDSGIWDYIATDQVTFLNQQGDVVELSKIPPLVFSEVMRDCDLFVGVASVGNDPQWQDNGGVRQYHDYWNEYSFGDLSELAKTRKTVLERLIPRLKIADKLTIKDKFLQVKGTKHTYDVHIGSGNILIQPHNKYLCIVAGRSKSKAVDNVFLPFEGDRGLSMVLSKAFLLVRDDKITDKTILSQI